MVLIGPGDGLLSGLDEVAVCAKDQIFGFTVEGVGCEGDDGGDVDPALVRCAADGLLLLEWGRCGWECGDRECPSESLSARALAAAAWHMAIARSLSVGPSLTISGVSSLSLPLLFSSDLSSPSPSQSMKI